MVVPVLGGQDGRNPHAEERGRGRDDPVVAPEEPCQQVAQGQHAQADPDREGVERTGVDVVALARLGGRRVEVDHQRDTRHHEEPHDDREVARVAVELVEQADQTQQEGEEIVGVAAAVLRHLARQAVLRSDVHPVDPADAREPVAVDDQLARGLDVALAAHEVPHEVAPVHVVELVGEEILHVLGERGFDDDLLFVAVVIGLALAEEHRLLLHDAPRLVADQLAVLVARRLRAGAVGRPGLVLPFALARVPHAREEVHELRRMGVARDRRGGLVAAVLVQIAEMLGLVSLGRCGVVGAVEQRPVAVLVAVEQRQQRMRVVGVVAVHRRIGGGADGHRCVGRETDEDH